MIDHIHKAKDHRKMKSMTHLAVIFPHMERKEQS